MEHVPIDSDTLTMYNINIFRLQCIAATGNAGTNMS